MKTRFNTIDIVAVITELNEKIKGMRVIQVYDVDHKVYLFKLGRQEEKSVLLVESGIRIHTTEFEWPKNPMPSSFSMKLRKHLKNKRLESINQLGIDRVIDLQFGSKEAAYHVIVELYDKGNIMLTDYQYIIMNILRPRAKGTEDVKLVVKERYPLESARQLEPVLSEEKLNEVLSRAKNGENLRKVLNPHVPYGGALIDHVLLKAGFMANTQIGKGFDVARDITRLIGALNSAHEILLSTMTSISKGYVTQKIEKHVNITGEDKEVQTNVEFHPYLFFQHEKFPYLEYSSFDKAADFFFSSLESQKVDTKALQQEKDALKKLEKIKIDHEKRLDSLQKTQEADAHKAELIEMNLQLVEKAILVIRRAIAAQYSWSDIWDLIQEAQSQGDTVAKSIKALKLETNHFTMLLKDPYAEEDSDDDSDDVIKENSIKPLCIDIDLGLSAYSNARKYHDQKRHAAKKEQKTIDASSKAYKSAEKKTKLLLKEVAVKTKITKSRKTFWFEKFLWFISSENYIVIGGRDAQQNELIVKRYFKPGDIYVHADVHGASSIVIKNPSGKTVPPKTLNEAGTMAMCYSLAWEAKVVTSAWWVHHNQVSKTAPTGEYLTAGSFMIRGTKNYLPPSHLIMGFGLLFKLDEESIPSHKDERKVQVTEDQHQELEGTKDEDIEVHVEDSGGEDNDEEPEAKTDGNPENTKKEENTEHKDDLNTEDAKASEVESDASSGGDEPAFPDTTVKIPSLQEVSPPKHDEEDEKDQEMDGSSQMSHFKMPPPPAKGKQKQRRPNKQTSNDDPPPQQQCQSLPALKRGQKSKLKKIKEKYKDQDEEERRLVMDILASAGSKDSKGKKGKKSKDGKQEANKKNQPKQPKAPTVTRHIFEEEGILSDKTLNEPKNFIQGSQNPASSGMLKPSPSDDEDQDEEEDQTPSNSDAQLLESLTGCPLPEDILMFAVPVCAPYSALHNYKYKIKLLPGTARKGKAVKTALNMFSHDKSATSREKDLLKTVKDQDISRNFPGKVKLATSNVLKKKVS